jgi:hypothetical protein
VPIDDDDDGDDAMTITTIQQYVFASNYSHFLTVLSPQTIVNLGLFFYCSALYV